MSEKLKSNLLMLAVLLIMLVAHTMAFEDELEQAQRMEAYRELSK